MLFAVLVIKRPCYVEMSGGSTRTEGTDGHHEDGPTKPQEEGKLLVWRGG